MYFERYYLGCLAHASYMIADEGTRIAAVIDPQRDIDEYLADADAKGFTIRYVFLTHFHADFVAGHIELRDKTGAHIYLGAKAQAEYQFTPVKDEDVIEFGKVRLKIMETPGHTPEGISILVYDLGEDDRKPKAVLTGDTLFIGDVGRPDLLASIGVTADELADMLYDSLHNKLMKLPDETLVYPAHGAGSMCGKQLSKEAFSTIGEQKKYNYALQRMSQEEFKRMVTADQPEAPDYFVHDAILNRQDRQSLEQSLKHALKPLPLEKVVSLEKEGAQLVDTRNAADFAGSHLAGSINIGLEGKYATWAGTILDKEKPIIVIAEPGQEEESVMRLGRIGFDNVVGYLEGGVEILENKPKLIEQIKRITARALADQIEKGKSPLILDVRTDKEWEAGHLDGSINIPLNHLEDQLGNVPQDRSVVVHCKGGYRSSLAASILKKNGVINLQDLVGGYDAWVASHLPVQKGEVKVG